MTKREFLRRMERARDILIKEKGFLGVCVAIDRAFCDPLLVARFTFSAYFKPGKVKPNKEWLKDEHHWNDNDDMTELERRLVFLESFKGFCLCYELHREW